MRRTGHHRSHRPVCPPWRLSLSQPREVARGRARAQRGWGMPASTCVVWESPSDVSERWLADPAVPLAGPVLAGAVLAGALLAGTVLAGTVLAGLVLPGPVSAGAVSAGAVLAGDAAPLVACASAVNAVF